MTVHWIWIALWGGVALGAAVSAVLALRRQPEHPFGWAMLIAAVSLCAAGAILAVGGRQPEFLQWATHGAAGLCLAWMVLTAAVGRLPVRIAGRWNMADVAQFVSLAAGMTAVLLLTYLATVEVVFRVFYLAGSSSLGASLPPTVMAVRNAMSPNSALADLAAIGIAAGIGTRRSRETPLVALLLWLTTFAALWVGLRIAPVRATSRPDGTPAIATSAAWVGVSLFCASVGLAAFVLGRRVLHGSRRRRAWPDGLNGLLAAPTAWPGFPMSAGIIAVMILAAGCLTLGQAWTFAAAAIAAAAMLLLAESDWSEGTAEAGMALATLAVAALMLVGTSAIGAGLNDYPVLFRRVLVALGIMTWLWYWLARVWEQQLHAGRAWTTTGRMIPLARHVGFIVAGIGVFMAIHLAVWPKMPLVTDADRSHGRFAGGLLALSFFAVSLIWTSTRYRRPMLGWLSIFAVGALLVFVHLRTLGSGANLWISRRAPLLLACAAPITAGLARLLRLTPANPYADILPACGVMLLPFATLVSLHVMHDSELAGRWVVAAALGVLAGWYAILSRVPGLRSLVWIALLLGALAVVAARRWFP